MTGIAIQADGLSKLYHIGKVKGPPKSLPQRLRGAVTSPFRRAAGLLRGNAAAAGDLEDEFWALQDVSFSIKDGERVAIIGGNGAGKSTLLKILARVTEPTRGSATIRGRVGSLLEVGTGFHSELTGRENVFLNGSILGMRTKEVRSKFERIVEFSGVQQFIDTPVKHYSSGMRVRLAFSVAAHLDPEVLIVDEVLSVGDAIYQKKCMDLIHEIADRGTTILVVSHQAQTVTGVCERALWLDKGRVVQDGPAHQTLAAYLGGGHGLSSERRWDVESAPGGEIARFRSVRLLGESRTPIEVLDVRQSCCIEAEIEVLKPGHGIVVNHNLFTGDGIEAFSAIDTKNPIWGSKTWPPGAYTLRMWIPRDFLQIDTYTVDMDMWAWEPGQLHQAFVPGALCFNVQEPLDGTSAIRGYQTLTGAIRPRLNWDMEPDIRGNATLVDIKGVRR